MAIGKSVALGVPKADVLHGQQWVGCSLSDFEPIGRLLPDRVVLAT
jgi:hypothetical protein